MVPCSGQALLPGALRTTLWRAARSVLLSAGVLCLVGCVAGAPPAPVSTAATASVPVPTRTGSPASQAVTPDPFTAFVNVLQTALDNNDNASLKALMGTPWFSGHYSGEPTQYNDSANALGAFETLRQGALITIDPSRVATERTGAQKIGDRALVARWVSRSGADSLAYFYLSGSDNQWHWTGLITDVPDTQGSVLPTDVPTPSGDLSFGTGHLVFTYDNKIVVRDLSNNAETVAADTLNGQRTQWDWSRDGARAVFVQADELWVVDRDGTDLRQLTGDRVATSAPHWSPDGTQILFERNVQSDRSGQFKLRGEVWLINTDGSGEHKLADGFDAEWSPDGQRVAFASNAQYTRGDVGDWTSYARNAIHLVNAQGRNEWAPLTTDMPSPRFTAMEWQLNMARLLDQPHWSPGGREIAVRASGNNGAYVATDSGSGGLTKFLALYFDGIAHGFSYSPDGNSIALAQSGLSGWDTLDVFRRSTIGRDGVSGAGLRTLGRVPKQAGDVGQKVVLYDWSPDSTRIAYVVVTYPNNDLTQPPAGSTVWICDVTTGAARQLTSGSGPLFWLP